MKLFDESLPISEDTPFRSRLLSATKSLQPQVPPSKESVWIGPFDQLVSSGYALLRADELEFAKRSLDKYYENVFCQIVNLVSKLADDREFSDPALKNYVSAIYFNAGFQRLTWAAERLITTFGAVRCTCHLPPDVTKKDGIWYFKESREGAKRRLQHDHFNSKLQKFREMLSQLDGWDKASYDPKKALSILREQVNPKKHSVYDYPLVQASRPWTNSGQQWNPNDQMSLAVGAFEVVCKAYCELLDWNLQASVH
jgi:hypothetical protein